MAKMDTDNVHDHMTRLRMKMIQQKIQNQKERIFSRTLSEKHNNNDQAQQAKLQQAMLRRQELLDKIRREQLQNEENNRPRTYSAMRQYTPSPLHIPPSRRSLQDYSTKVNLYNNHYPEAYRSQPEMSQVKHVVEHKIATPRAKPYYLPPVEAPLQQPPPVIIQAPPPPRIMQQQAPQIIQAPYPQQIIQQVPSPVIQTLPGFQPEQKGMFNKAGVVDTILLQNAQLQQLMMQQMLSNSGKYPRVPVVDAVHHHHYTSPPPSQPAIHHYTTMPAMDIRGGYPLREYGSAYTGPGYAYSPYDDGNNYYTYH